MGPCRQKPNSLTHIDTEAGGDGVGKKILADTNSEYEQLRRENVATILSYGVNFMDNMVCRDACDGHDVRRTGKEECCTSICPKFLLTRVAESAVGAHTLLQCGVMQRLAGCVFFDLRRNFDRDEAGVDTEEDFLPSPMARYRQLLFAALKFCLAMLTSLGIENQDCGNQVMQFI
ncbi:nuclear pore complex protein Nup205-like isoform X2 [Saccostrea cucullata]|uniref:nuclear pore complex protein Nup205-like isoform X2 n=1 Tax=Saccostrea cuccullata TaxID=36930 RepID=UPI002ED449AA